MKKLLTVLTVVIVISSVSFSQTYISGNINTATWDSTGNPYIVIGDVVTDDLTILPGVEIIFDYPAVFNIYGCLNAVGTAEDSIHIHAGATNWKRFQIQNSVGYLKYVLAEDAEYYYFSSAFSFYNSSASIKSCTFRNNNVSNLISASCYSSTTNTLKVESCDFYNNTCEAQFIYTGYSESFVNDCRFFNNTARNIIWFSDEKCVVYRNTFADNECDFVIDMFKGMIANSVFYNTVDPGQPVFYFPEEESDCEIVNCIVWGCDSITTFPEYTRITFSDLEIPYPGEGNISAEPIFVDPANNDFRLQPGSPCIDTGHPGGAWRDTDLSIGDMGVHSSSGIVPLNTNIDFGPMFPDEKRTKEYAIVNLTDTTYFWGISYFLEPNNYFTWESIQGGNWFYPGNFKIFAITATSPGTPIGNIFISQSWTFYFDSLSVNLTAGVEGWTPVSGVLPTGINYFYENIVVPDGEYLIVEPGTNVKFDNGCVMKVCGNLTAIGSPTQWVLFQAIDDRWGGIIFEEADSIITLDNVMIYGAQGSPETGMLGGCIYAENSILNITNSRIEGYNDYDTCSSGAGIYALDCSELTLKYTDFEDCHASEQGGGIYAENVGSIIIDSCYFYDLHALEQGGGAYFNNCPHININNTLFKSCVEDEWNYGEGGAIYFNNSSAVIDSCWFENCYVSEDGTGGAMYLNNSDVEITRTIIKECYINDGIGAILALNINSEVTFDHSDIYFIGTINDYAISILDAQSNIACTNSIFYSTNNLQIASSTTGIGITYSITQQTWAGVGNLVGNPLITPDSLRLTSSSPCIDAGDPNYPPDPDGTRTDMGAFYWEGGGGGAISGAVSGTWTSENNPYQIGGAIYISAEDTLDIDEGVIVQFLGDYNFTIYGILLITGEENNYAYIYGGDESDLNITSVIGVCHLQYGYLSFDDINISGEPVFINKCDVNADINATGSSNNSLINSELHGHIHYGSNWWVNNNSIYYYLGSSGWWMAYPKAIQQADGVFTNNTVGVTAVASYSGGSASATAFSECSGEIAYNFVVASASAEYEGSLAIGNCTAEIHHNCLKAESSIISNCIGNIYNNDIDAYYNTIRCDYGIINITGDIYNNIITDCDVGISNCVGIRYSCVYNCGIPYQSVNVGPGNIQENPLFISPQSNNYNLQANSPCIDAGDPNSPLDPDGTIADMGAYYYDQSGTPQVTISLIPYNPPILIPANGGTFDFNITVENPEIFPAIVDIWTMATLPNGNEYGPIIGPVNLTLNPGYSGNRDRTQNIPASAPSGLYTYDAYIGTYPGSILDEDHFDFEKLAVEDGSVDVHDWSCWGEDFEEEAVQSLMPSETALHSPYPNPFNASTVISFELRDAGEVSLVMYDLQGRKVQSLVNGHQSMGYHEVVFDGTNLSSGMYFVRLQAEEFTQTRKLLLIK